MNIRFEKASTLYVDIIFGWLSEPHMMEFWDNSKEHKDDILNFIHNKPQSYFAGTAQYWVGFINDEPFAFILSDILKKGQKDLSKIHLDHMSKTGHTIGLDFAIGNKQYLGRGLAAKTLSAFMLYYKRAIDSKADTFFIDPDENNPKAMHVYKKSGFIKIGQYNAVEGHFIGHTNDLMIKTIDDTNIDFILEELKSREPIFHHPLKFGKTKEDIEAQMCDEFTEVGASGNIYTKEDIIETLLERYINKKYKDIYEISDFEIIKISKDSYLLRYNLIQNHTRYTRRSTIWKKVDGLWKILYHQGTVVEDRSINRLKKH